MNGRQKIGRGHVHPEIVNGEAVAAHQRFEDILADVVNVAFHRSQHQFTRVGMPILVLDQGKEDLPDLAHDLAGHDQSRNGVTPLFVVLADADHAFVADVENEERVDSRVDEATDLFQRLFFLKLSNQMD